MRELSQALTQESAPRPRAKSPTKSNAIRMTDRWLQTLSIKTGRRQYADMVSPGLRLQASRTAPTWSVVFQRDGKTQRRIIGQYPDMPFTGARVIADGVRASIDAPATAFRRKGRSPCFSVCCWK